MTGRDKGKTGTVTKAIPADNRVVVDGVNVRTKNVKHPGGKGTQVTLPMPIDVSNVMIYDAKSKKGTRVGRKLVGEKFVRISKRTGNEI